MFLRVVGKQQSCEEELHAKNTSRTEVAAKSYVLGWTSPQASFTLRRSLEEVPTTSSGVCAQCDPVLSRHVSDFKSLVHRGG